MTQSMELSIPVDVKVHHVAHLDEEALAALDAITHRLDRMDQTLRRVLRALELTLTLEEHQMADLSALTAEVAENADAVASAVTLLGSLSEQIRELSTDPAALQALADSLDANTRALADAVVANTPAAPEPPAEPVA